MKTNYITDYIQTQAGKVPRVLSLLTFRDYLGAVMVRWSIKRNNYRVKPGIYAVGTPDENSDVFITANYKLSFDHLRKNLDGLNAWILVLDTKGINVWCAAGKGTFGTTELVNRIRLTELEKIVSHRKIILPQLGATGVSAYQVKAETSSSPSNLAVKSNSTPINTDSLNSVTLPIEKNRGFNIIFGPVRASDIKNFIRNGYQSTQEMRKVTFNFSDRIKLAPVDFVYARYKLLFVFVFVFIFIISGVTKSGINFNLAYDKGFSAIANIFLAYITGIAITPVLLHYIPVKMFAFKGLISGLALSFILLYFNKLGSNYFEISSWILIISGIS